MLAFSPKLILRLFFTTFVSGRQELTSPPFFTLGFTKQSLLDSKSSKITMTPATQRQTMKTVLEQDV